MTLQTTEVTISSSAPQDTSGFNWSLLGLSLPMIVLIRRKMKK